MLLTVAVVVSYGEFHAHLIGHYPFTEFPRFGWLLVFVVLIWVATYSLGLPEEAGGLASALARSSVALFAASGLVSVFALIVGTPLLPRFVVFASDVTLIPLIAATSFASRGSSRQLGPTVRLLAIMGPAEAQLLEIDLQRSPERDSVLVATLSPEEARRGPTAGEPLIAAATEHRATMVVLDRLAQGESSVVEQAAALHRGGTRIRTLPLFYDEWLGKVPLSELERMSLLFDINELHRRAYPRTKRFLDLVLGVLGLLPFALSIPVVALLDLFGNRGPLFYRQDRVGKDGRVFTILKFRTMAPSSAETTWTTADDPRLNRVGRMLRRAHLDELPQVWNVLRRDLAIVGPRPEQPRYVEELATKIPYYDLRHVVRPGITGWAQVKYDYGASEVDAFEKLQYEFYYLRHQSVALDLRIMGRTLRSIVGQRGR